MARPIVLDLETQKTFQEAGSKNPGKLGVSLVGIYSYDTNEYSAYREEELSNLFPLLEQASVTIGFNINNFDFPVLDAYYVGTISRLATFDLLESVKERIGKRIALNELAKETLAIKKSGHGLQAINYYREGKWDKLKKYCLDDVRITKDLFEYGKKRGNIFYMSPWGRREIRVDWKNIEANSGEVNMTLGI